MRVVNEVDFPLDVVGPGCGLPPPTRSANRPVSWRSGKVGRPVGTSNGQTRNTLPNHTTTGGYR